MSVGAVLEGLTSAPELSSGTKERVGRGWLRRPRNYTFGSKECVGRGWLRLWGVVGAPSVDRSPKGDAASSPEFTVGADGDAVNWYDPRSITYSRCGGIKVLPAATRSP